jgi:glucosamine-6-phosphate deaminase
MILHAPHLEVLADRASVAARAAALVVARLRDCHPITLGLATGATMTPLYARLSEACRTGAISFRDVTSFNLDEHVGVPPAEPGSFEGYMHKHLLDHVDMAPGHAHLLDGMADDLDAEAAGYEGLIAATGGIDLQLLGIGANGHIGYNEPGADFASRTRQVTLDPTTRRANAASFPLRAAPPERAVTMGIATILEARSILVIATGRTKAPAIAAALEGPVSTGCPASALRLHGDVTILCDEEAASLLAAFQNKARKTG